MRSESAIIIGVSIIALIIGGVALYQTITLNEKIDSANIQLWSLQNSYDSLLASNNALQSTVNSLNTNLSHAMQDISTLQASYSSLQNNYTILASSFAGLLEYLGLGGQGSMSFDSYSVVSNIQINVYLRNTGTKLLIITDAYVDGQVANISPDNAPLGVGQILSLTITGLSTNWANGASHQVRVVASDGTPLQFSVVKT